MPNAVVQRQAGMQVCSKKRGRGASEMPQKHCELCQQQSIRRARSLLDCLPNILPQMPFPVLSSVPPQEGSEKSQRSSAVQDLQEGPGPVLMELMAAEVKRKQRPQPSARVREA